MTRLHISLIRSAEDKVNYEKARCMYIGYAFTRSCFSTIFSMYLTLKSKVIFYLRMSNTGRAKYKKDF